MKSQPIIIRELPYQVKIVRTVVGWYNVYLVETGERVTLSPVEFAQHFPDVDPRVVIGCTDVDADTLEAIGLTVPALVVAVS